MLRCFCTKAFKPPHHLISLDTYIFNNIKREFLKITSNINALLMCANLAHEPLVME